MSNHLDILTQLQDYIDTRAAADTSLKAAFWSVTKARQTTVVSAANVREDVTARTRLTREEPELAEDSLPTFRVVDVVEQEQLEKENAASRTAPLGEDGKGLAESNTGLRQRKGRKEDKDQPAVWQVEDVDDDRLQQAVDPIDLFGGLAPRDLKKAQAQAKEALLAYVQAANLLRSLDSKLSANEK